MFLSSSLQNFNCKDSANREQNSQACLSCFAEMQPILCKDNIRGEQELSTAILFNLKYGGLPLASLHAAVFQFVAICIILLALAHRWLGEFDSHHCGARHAAVNRGIECMHMTRQKPLADGSQRLAFLGIIIHNRGRAICHMQLPN